jgi:hypothetical protein
MRHQSTEPTLPLALAKTAQRRLPDFKHGAQVFSVRNDLSAIDPIDRRDLAPRFA